MPRIPISTDDDPSKGNANAAITIVQFAEFQCPYCGQADKVVEQVLKEYDGKVKMVFRDYPLGFHDRAVPAAVAAPSGGRPGQRPRRASGSETSHPGAPGGGSRTPVSNGEATGWRTAAHVTAG